MYKRNYIDELSLCEKERNKLKEITKKRNRPVSNWKKAAADKFNKFSSFTCRPATPASTTS